MFKTCPQEKNISIIKRSSYLVHRSRLLASHPGLAPSSRLLKGLSQQVAVATHPLIPKAHPGGAIHHLVPNHAWLLLSIISFLLRSHHGPVHATHHSSSSVLLLLHHVGLLLRGKMLLLPLAHHLWRPLAWRCLHVRQVLPHGGGTTWAAHGSLVPLLGGGGCAWTQKFGQLFVLGHCILTTRTPSRTKPKTHSSRPSTASPRA